jgi:hypothetical protein
MHVVFVVIGIALGVIGAFSLTQATMGVGLIGLACFAGILARMAQAEMQASAARKREQQRSVAATAEPARVTS